MKVFVTGGGGFIGSHTSIELLQNNHNILVYDNFLNGHIEALRRVKQITNQSFKIIKGDVRDFGFLKTAMINFKPDIVIHFAGLKSVKESLLTPERYYDYNIGGTLQLLKAMKHSGCTKIIFSSSATVYKDTNDLPYKETHNVLPQNPYGKTKLIVEDILKDWIKINPSNKAVCLRYFNPAGAHFSGMIGEYPKENPNNLMPIVAEVALKKRKYLTIFGNNYKTRDGTGERDYVHVMDLALGHLQALEKIDTLAKFETLNLGTGNGTTVMELVNTFEEISGQKIKIKFVSRRDGDVARSFACPELCTFKLDIVFKRNVKEICTDFWRWLNLNPNGY